MKNIDLKEYLNTFPDDADVGFLLANPGARKLYECVHVFVITDAEHPVFCIHVGKEADMDEELKAVCEADERKEKKENEDCTQISGE